MICWFSGEYANQSPVWLPLQGMQHYHVLCRDFFLANPYMEYHKSFIATAQVSMSSNDRLYRGHEKTSICWAQTI